MGIKFSAIKETQKAVNKLSHAVGGMSEELVVGILNGISTNTKPYVPVDTGNLINSERIEHSTTGTTVRGTISYGGGEKQVDYADYVHEGPQLDWQKAGASNLYLTKGIQDFLRDDLESVIKNAVGD